MKKIYIIVLSLFLFGTPNTYICAQKYGLSFGLSHKQPENELPKSRVPIVFPEKKPKLNIKSELTPVANNEYIISKGWELIEVNSRSLTTI